MFGNDDNAYFLIFVLTYFWMWHGATDSAKDYGARGPRFDSLQWISPKMAFFRKTTTPYFLLSFCNSFHYKKYLCSLWN